MTTLYTKCLTREEAQAQFDKALSELPRALADYYRGCVDFDRIPAEGALWLRQSVRPGASGSVICALQDASLALIGYHNTLVVEAFMAEERAAHEAEEERRLRSIATDEWWAKRKRPPERVDDVSPDETPQEDP